MSKIRYPYIVKTPGMCFGKPRIDGHRIRVQDIAIWVERQRMTPDEIAGQYDLTLAEVHSALAYYFDHIEEIKADIRAGEARVEQLQRNHVSKLPSRA